MNLLRLIGAATLAAGLVACSDVSSTPATNSPSPAPTTQSQQPAGSPSPAPSGSSSGGLGAPEHDGKKAMQHVEALATTIGPRVAGTDAERKAIEYISSQFKFDGYDVELMDFTFDGDRFRVADVTLEGKTYSATTAAKSSGGNASGQSVFVGLADDAGLANKDLGGKIAVADRGTLTFGEKAQNVVAKGAAGLIILNNQAGSVSADLRSPQPIPVVGAAGEDAPVLRAAAEAGKAMRISAPGLASTRATNVIARSKTGGACAVVVGGHFDTVASAPGANDNASGTANVLELARAFAADGLDDGLCFVTFSAEESGLYGSEALAQRFKAEGQVPKLMVNVDVTGIGKQVEVIGDRDYVSQVLGIAESIGVLAIRSSLPASTGSDHMSFQQIGVPVVYFTSGDFANLHTPADVAKDVDEAELDRVGDLAYATITRFLPQVARG